MDTLDQEMAAAAMMSAYYFFGGNADYETWEDAAKAVEAERKDRCCLPCQVKWKIAEDTTERCWVCNKKGKIGHIADYCPHGVKKYEFLRQFHCAKCSTS